MALTKCKECGKELSDQADRCPHCGWAPSKHTGQWIGFAILVLIAVVVLSNVLSTPTSCARPRQKETASRTIGVSVDTEAVRYMEKLNSRRATMEALLSKEAAWNRQFKAAMDAGSQPDKFQQNSGDKRKYDMLNALADSIAVRLEGSVTGLTAGNLQTTRPRLLSFDWSNAADDPGICFSLFVNYKGNWNGDGFPSKHLATGDIAAVAADMAPSMFRYYPRLEAMELHEFVDGWVVATLAVTRNTVEGRAANADSYRRLVQLNKALVKTGKMN